MNIRHLVAVLVLAAACSGPEAQPADDMTSMTPEEHARMQAGGNQGEVDSTGVTVRQDVHLTADQERSLGEEFSLEIRHEGSFLRDEVIVGYVERLGAEIVRAAGPQPFFFGTKS